MNAKLMLILPALLVAGCSTLNFNPSVATPGQIIVAVNAFDASEATATNYLTLPDCAKTAAKVCRSASVTATVAKAVKDGRAARDQLMADVQANTSAPITLMQALSASVATLQQVNQ